MQTYLSIMTHPLLWVFLCLLVGFYLILWTAGLDVRRQAPRTIWLRRNYPAVILTGVAILAIIALTFYLIEIGISVRILVDRLREAAKDPWTSTSELQSLASAVAILVGVLAAAATILYSSIRVWINERTATATEEGLITDRINKAVQGLGAEKVVNRLGRTARYTVDGVDGSYFEWIDDRQTPPDNPDVVDGKVKLTNDPWSSFPDTQPNLEVRIGSIYALERIAQDSDRDHVQVMEILCAYIRQNAPDTLAEPLPEKWQKALDAAENDIASIPSRVEMFEWATNQQKPREDIQVALTVLGRRTPRQIALEGHGDAESEWVGYRLDLRNSCLQNAYLRDASFENARFNHTKLQGADLSVAMMQAADFSDAQMQGTNLSRAKMQRTNFRRAKMQGANLCGTKIQEADFLSAQMQKADLSAAHMKEANFLGAKMQGADLRGAKFEEADLRGAKLQAANIVAVEMQGADLFGAQMQGTELHWAKKDATTNFSSTALRGASLRFVDLSDTNISQEQVDSLFGDQTVTLPKGLTRPDWPEIDEDDMTTFRDKWRAWQKSIGFVLEDASTW
ncbi:pentapeptide repeat-containing protein [Microbulbifer sp. S227A]|uniref:pentapeptide repeat-containing protein n=1 Tax=Microbulbifer sp. S227A TaxID=3415131 RepID=UPI003C7E8401